jgi:hypothetical protein
MDIDAVITWVDGDDPLHAEKRAFYSGESNHPVSTSATRFASRGELKYSVLSILRFCPFVRKIHIVTDGQDPGFLWQVLAPSPEWHAKVEVVDHSAIYREHSDLLPVFSSRSIETMLHRIPGLSEHFIYFNDDMFIGRPLEPDFFFRSGKPVLRGDFRKSRGRLTWLKQCLRRGVKRPSFKEAQKEAAGVVGFTGRYFLAEHLPYPMRCSTLHNYYVGRPDELRQQAGHRFRSAKQLSPIGLANHLELLEGAPFEPSTRGGYIKPPKSDYGWKKVARTLADLKNGELAALCVQSLDQFADHHRRAVLFELDDWYVHDYA